MNTLAIHPANFTRRTPDLAGKFRRERRYGTLALYHFLRLSDLGREGIELSGSFRFADHLYANRASGRGPLGWLLDRVLLSLPAARAMRQRCTAATAEMSRAFAGHRVAGRPGPFRILTVPCGLPRDVRDFVALLEAREPGAAARIEYTGLDLDADAIGAAQSFLAGSAVRRPHFVHADALEESSYAVASFDFIASTGLGEFLDDEQVGRLYANVYRALAPGGTFFTSALAREPRSDTLLRAFEFDAHYRTGAEIERLLDRQEWSSVRCTRDDVGLGSLVRASKPL
jgi:SAM-dependent methyltransferase